MASEQSRVERMIVPNSCSSKLVESDILLTNRKKNWLTSWSPNRNCKIQGWNKQEHVIMSLIRWEKPTQSTAGYWTTPFSSRCTCSPFNSICQFVHFRTGIGDGSSYDCFICWTYCKRQLLSIGHIWQSTLYCYEYNSISRKSLSQYYSTIEWEADNHIDVICDHSLQLNKTRLSTTSFKSFHCV